MPFAITVSAEFAEQFPSDPAEQLEVLELGLRELRIRKALETYRAGEGSLAYAARRAEISLREMIPLAFAHGIEPRVEPELLDDEVPLTRERAAEL